MEGILTCLHRIVPDAETHNTIHREMEIYWDASVLFGFDDTVYERTILMPCKSLEFKTLDF